MPPKAKTETQLVIPAPKIEMIAIPIEGVTSLIVHSWSEKAIRQMLGKQMGVATIGRDKKDPEAEYNAARYTTKDGWDGVLCGAFKSAMVGASRQVKVTGITLVLAKTLFFVEADGRCVKPVAVNGQIYTQTHDVVRIQGEPQMRMDMARNDNRSADIRFRPEYFPWSAVLRVRYNASMISAEQIANLVSIAGISQGVGEQRPSSPINHSGSNGLWRIAK